jgi:hypothetical protein
LHDPLASRFKLGERRGQIVEHGRGSDLLGSDPDAGELLRDASRVLRRRGRNPMLGDPVSHVIEQLSVPSIIIGPERPTVEIDQGNTHRLEDSQDEGGTGEPQAIPEHQLAILAVEPSVGTASECVGYLMPVARISAILSILDKTAYTCNIVDFLVFKEGNDEMVGARLGTGGTPEPLMPQHVLHEQHASDAMQYPRVRSILGTHDEQG